MMRRAIRFLLIAGAALLALVVVVAVVRIVAAVAAREAAPSSPIATAEIGGSVPGSLVSAVSIPGLVGNLARESNAARVLYRSTSGDTRFPTVVSGTVFTPKGMPPSGGWPVVSFGHGTTGVQQPCAPSLSATLLGQAPVVLGLVKLGYAVAFADYQGLGADGIHPYLDARTAGLNMIDAVRALRHTFPDVSDKWAAFGGSQGGGAAWAANEEAALYAPDLQLVGAVALSPAADMVGLVEKAERGRLTVDQGPVLQWVLVSLGRLHPDLDVDEFRHGSAAQQWAALSACSGSLATQRAEAVKSIGPHDFSPSTPEAAARLRSMLGDWALPHRRLSAPLSVIYGDADTYIDQQWTAAAISRACALGGTVAWRLESGKGHADVDGGDQIAWLKDRFGGKDMASDC